MAIQNSKVGTILAAILLVVIVLGGAYAWKYIKGVGSDLSSQAEQFKGPHLVVSPAEYDFGVVKQSGGIVSMTFEIVNDGSEEVVITGTPASCSCTSASVDKTTLAPGERGELTVRFDPNYHYEDDGKFFRTVTVKSNSVGTAPEAKIWVEVIYDLGKDKLKFNKGI